MPPQCGTLCGRLLTQCDHERTWGCVTHVNGRDILSKGGTAADIREWAETAEDGAGALVGVVRAYVYPLRDGVGSADVVPLLTY